MKSHNGHILILGAGLMQRPAIEAARSLGYKVTLVDANPAALCVPLADRFEPIDLKNRDAIRDLALELKEKDGLTAVFTAGTDFSAAVSYASAACGFAAHSVEAALNASDKIRMRGCFKTHGVPSPHFMQVDEASFDSVCLTADRLGSLLFPLVVKPVDNMGGRGCRLIRARDELEPALRAAMENSRSGRAILEDYMNGPEFSIDALVYDGTVTVCGFADRHIFYPPYFIETGHTMPTTVSEKDRLELIAAFARGIQALGLTCGAAKADIKLTRKGPMIGEIAARLSGGYMSGWTYPYASDCPLTEQAELIAAGKEPAWLLAHRQPLSLRAGVSGAAPFDLYEVPSARICAERAWISVPGTVAAVCGLSEAASVPGVRDVLPRFAAGAAVVFPHNNVEKCGNVIAVSADRTEAVSAAEHAVRCIVLRLEADNPATDAFLAGRTVCAGEDGYPPAAFPLDSAVSAAFDSFLGRSDAEHTAVRYPVSAHIPACLLPVADTVRDWSYRTIRQSAESFDKMISESGPDSAAGVPESVFWRACVRGGLQGMLYAADSAGVHRSAAGAPL